MVTDRAGKDHRYRVVDVFTDQPLAGNALAVFPDGRGLDRATMQKIARELNLSETTFVVPATRAGCTAGVRIFTPARELPFAGHPTLGTGFVLMEEGLVKGGERFKLEEEIGAVPVRIERGERPLVWLRTPAVADGPLLDRRTCARALGLEIADILDIPPQVLSAGNPTLVVALKDKETVDRAHFDAGSAATLKREHHEPMCVLVFSRVEHGTYSRMFAPDYGIVEDPATGSAMGPLAVFMMRHDLLPSAAGIRFINEQGTQMQRRSVLHVHVEEPGVAAIEVGGHVTPVARATMSV